MRDDYASVGGCAPSGGAWDVCRLPSADPRDGALAGPPAILALHSRAYPGAVAITTGRHWAWAYTGWGLPTAPAGSAGAAPYPAHPAAAAARETTTAERSMGSNSWRLPTPPQWTQRLH